MNQPTLKRIGVTVRQIIALLVQSRYDELANLTKATRLKSEDIADGVKDYGRTLIMPPESAYEKIDVIQVVGRKPDQYSVRFDLFTQEEGRSDLTIEMTLIDDNHEDQKMRVEIDGIHVL